MHVRAGTQLARMHTYDMLTHTHMHSHTHKCVHTHAHTHPLAETQKGQFGPKLHKTCPGGKTRPVVEVEPLKQVHEFLVEIFHVFMEKPEW